MLIIQRVYKVCERLFLNQRMAKDQASIQKTIKSFEAYLSVEMQLGTVTIEGYLKLISKFLKDTNTVFPTRDVIITWLAKMRKAKASYSHMRNTGNCLMHFMKYRGIADFKLKPPKRPRRIIKDIGGIRLTEVHTRCSVLSHGRLSQGSARV